MNTADIRRCKESSKTHWRCRSRQTQVLLAKHISWQ